MVVGEHTSLLTAAMQLLSKGVGNAEPLLGGEMNDTYRVSSDDGGTYVVRFPRDHRDSSTYELEAWAAGAAVTAGIRTATVLASGVHDDVPFLVLEYIGPGPECSPGPWSWLGGYARRLSTVNLEDAPESLFDRFGRDLGTAWAAHLRYNRDALTAQDYLATDGAYSPDQHDTLLQALSLLEESEFHFGIAHGDLAPRNLISQGIDAPPALIDWGAAHTGPTPWTDARRVLEWALCEENITLSELHEFMNAAQLSDDSSQRTLIALQMIHLVDVARWAYDQRPDLYPEYLEKCRTGLEKLIPRF